jgi:hypothetical protein
MVRVRTQELVDSQDILQDIKEDYRPSSKYLTEQICNFEIIHAWAIEFLCRLSNKEEIQGSDRPQVC